MLAAFRQIINCLISKVWTESPRQGRYNVTCDIIINGIHTPLRLKGKSSYALILTVINLSKTKTKILKQQFQSNFTKCQFLIGNVVYPFFFWMFLSPPHGVRLDPNIDDIEAPWLAAVNITTKLSTAFHLCGCVDYILGLSNKHPTLTSTNMLVDTVCAALY